MHFYVIDEHKFYQKNSIRQKIKTDWYLISPVYAPSMHGSISWALKERKIKLSSDARNKIQMKNQYGIYIWLALLNCKKKKEKRKEEEEEEEIIDAKIKFDVWSSIKSYQWKMT